MTSNIGSDLIIQNDPDGAIASLRSFFKPEFLNRIDETVVFNVLQKEDVKRIVNILLKGLSKRCLNNGFQLSTSNDTIDHIVDVGYDPAYGARPLKRAILKEIETPLAEYLINQPKPQTVKVDFDTATQKIIFSS